MHMSSVQELNVYDVAIVGAGPVGLFAITACGMIGLKSVCIESSTFVGGQCMALYPEKVLYGVPGMIKETGEDLIDRLLEQANQFNPKFLLGHNLNSIQKIEGDIFLLKTSNSEVLAKNIIIASGKGSFIPNRINIDRAEEFEGKSIFYSIKDKNIFKGKNVCIAGGGDSAIDWCIEIANLANKAFLVHRRDKFRCNKHNENKLNELSKNSNILEIKTPYRLHSIEGEDGNMTSLSIMSGADEIENIKVDFLLPFFGLVNQGITFEVDGLDLSQDNKIIVNSNMESSVDRIFAIGDASTYRSKMSIIISGFSEAIQVADIINSRVSNKGNKDLFSIITKP